MSRGYIFNLVMALTFCKNLRRIAPRAYKCINIQVCNNFSLCSKSRIQQISIYEEPSEPKPNTYIHLVSGKGAGFPYKLTKEEENTITREDPQAKQELQALLLFLYLKRERGEVLPECISIKDFSELLFLKDDEVEYMLQLLFYRDKQRQHSKEIQKAEKREFLKRQQEMSDCRDHHYLYYGFERNSLFTPVIKTNQSRYYNYVMWQGLQFGQNLLFDCSFDDYMNIMQVRETAKHLRSCISRNRRSRRPFSISLCNVTDNGRMVNYLKKINPALGFDLPIHIHNCSYLDLFRREDIVYLSPYAYNELEYHPDDVYVIGALSEHPDKLSLKKARLEGVRCANLPVGYRQLMRKTQVLKIEEVFDVLISKKDTGEWVHATKMPNVRSPR